jgi:hypothetical protein
MKITLMLLSPHGRRTPAGSRRCTRAAHITRDAVKNLVPLPFLWYCRKRQFSRREENPGRRSNGFASLLSLRVGLVAHCSLPVCFNNKPGTALTSGVPRHWILRNRPSLNICYRNKAFLPSRPIISFSPRLACDGMKGLSCAVDWLRPDRSFLVPVGIASGHLRMLQTQSSRSMSNWRPIAGFVRRSQDRSSWNFVFRAWCLPLFLNTSELGGRSKERS